MDNLSPYSKEFHSQVLIPLAERALAGQDIADDLCRALKPWVDGASAKICRSLPALRLDEVNHLVWMAVLDSIGDFDPTSPESWSSKLRKRVHVVRADAVRAEIGRTGKRRVMSVPIRWFLYLPVDHLMEPVDPVISAEDEERVEALLDQLPPDLAGLTRNAMETGTTLPPGAAARVATLLGLNSAGPERPSLRRSQNMPRQPEGAPHAA